MDLQNNTTKKQLIKSSIRFDLRIPHQKQAYEVLQNKKLETGLSNSQIIFNALIAYDSSQSSNRSQSNEEALTSNQQEVSSNSDKSKENALPDSSTSCSQNPYLDWLEAKEKLEMEWFFNDDYVLSDDELFLLSL